ncbi:MAG TPA: SLC13 family permease [Woeseiaceae bacterium]|nr:SLC13 family permease [Woeseiaceae bacterium]
MTTFPETLDPHALAVMLLVVVALFLFSSSRISMESSGLAVLTAMVVGFELFPFSGPRGELGPGDFLAGFSNPALITIVALLICSKALEVTGALHTTTHLLAGLWRRNPRGALLATMFAVAIASMFMNNTPLVAMTMPVLVAVCIRTQTPVTGVLMPVGYATIIGGMATTIGTSTNLLVVDLAERLGMQRFEMFDFALPVVIAGSVSIVFVWLIAPKVLPDRSAPMTDTTPRIFRGVMHVTPGSPAEGLTVSEVLAKTHGRMQLDRIERGTDLFIARLPTTILRSGDRLYVRGQSRQLKEFELQLGAPLWTSGGATSESARSWVEEKTQQRLAEIVITSASALNGQTLGQSALLGQYGLSPIAVHAPKGRARDNAEELRNLEDLKLRVGDVVLVQGDPNGINRLKQTGQLLVLDSAIDLPHTSKAGTATAITAGVILAAAVGLMPILVSSLAGVVLCIATRCIQWRQLRAAIDANLVVMIVAALAMGEGLLRTGATDWMAGQFVAAAGDLSPALFISLLMLAAALLTEVVTNNAVAVLITPIAFSIASGLGVDPTPFVLAVMFGANMSYMTPFGYQTNMMVMNAGGYHFTDFVRLGLPLQIVIWALLSWLLAMGVGPGA